MDLGWFSISLTVSDIAASRSFYEKLGFEVTGGDQSQNWLILVSRRSTVRGTFWACVDSAMSIWRGFRRVRGAAEAETCSNALWISRG